MTGVCSVCNRADRPVHRNHVTKKLICMRCYAKGRYSPEPRPATEQSTSAVLEGDDEIRLGAPAELGRYSTHYPSFGKDYPFRGTLQREYYEREEWLGEVWYDIPPCSSINMIWGAKNAPPLILQDDQWIQHNISRDIRGFAVPEDERLARLMKKRLTRKQLLRTALHNDFSVRWQIIADINTLLYQRERYNRYLLNVIREHQHVRIRLTLLSSPSVYLHGGDAMLNMQRRDDRDRNIQICVDREEVKQAVNFFHEIWQVCWNEQESLQLIETMTLDPRMIGDEMLILSHSRQDDSRRMPRSSVS